jgi:phosphoenolpyruvate-protein kinase (PTS system EI component)
MKRLGLLVGFVVCTLLGASVFSEIYNSMGEEPVAESGIEAVQEPELLTKSLADMDGAEISAVSDEASSEIAILSAQIKGLEDKNLEPELQRQIEQLKLESEIAHINSALAKAQKVGDSRLVEEYSAELEHLSRINEPVVGDENEQPAP